MDALAGVVGVVLTSGLNAATTSAGDMYDAACVIGGISLAGGKGCIVGSIIGALIIAVLCYKT